jgi:hypothetical protein
VPWAQDERAAGSNATAVVYMGMTVVCVAGLLAAVSYGIYLLTQ